MTQRERELLRQRVSASLPPPEEGRVDNLLFFFNLDRKRLSLSLGPRRAWRVMDESTSDHTHPPSRQQAAVGSSRASSKATHAPSAQIMEAGHGPGPYIPPRCPTAGTSVVPMVPLVRCLGAGSCPAVSLAPMDHLTRL